ncbi:ribonuclease H-like domain-containing protein [Lentinula aciculospora]|uniref:RNA exonuclease 4 n=1 Tax=Lentinula aciculospora TaxID=153920 RepID=A0A9W9A211_9AGAR|nr:ribonuclease H-like domain-containing protein [Lentinula aciculospora]
MSKSVVKSNPASSNWLALQKKLDNKSTGKKHVRSDEHSRKRFTMDYAEKSNPSSASSSATTKSSKLPFTDDLKNGESLSSLRHMVVGEIDYPSEHKQPGKYIAIDCEMVGVGIDGSESSLARVTLVNYHGAVQMDEFVRQRERVVDYRTQYSGIRESDMKKAKPFDEIQKTVAELLQDRTLVGHAIHNDLKALLLSHPWNLTRDTQHLAGKSKVVRSKYIALRKLVEQELGIIIQAGEHSSLVDARATMAVYRLHRKEWDKGLGNVNTSKATMLVKALKSKSRPDDDGEEKEPEEQEFQDAQRKDDRRKSKGLPEVFPGGGRKGVSSGLSTVVRNGGSRSDNGRQKTQWWKELGNSGSNGSKGFLRL